MGLFDTVRFKCPARDCGATIDMTSKAADNPSLRTFDQNRVPSHIAMSLLRKRVTCEKCKREFHVPKVPIPTVQLYLEVISDIEEDDN